MPENFPKIRKKTPHIYSKENDEKISKNPKNSGSKFFKRWKNFKRKQKNRRNLF